MSFTIGYGEIAPPILYLGSAATGADEFEVGDPGFLPHGQFEINGIRFPINPQSISIYEENFNHQFQTLRTRESTKVRSGHSRINIRLTALFTGVSVGLDADNSEGHSLGTINRSLMPILYSLKKMPLCFIDNELVRRSLPLVNNEVVLNENGVSSTYYTGEVIGAFVQSVNVSTVPGFPHTLSAEFQLVWYNHRPFTNRLEFRKSWIDSLGEQPSRVFMLTDLYGPVNKGRGLVKGANPDEATEAHAGRSEFIANFGHPSIAFNATTFYTRTYRIQEARPLLEYLWPYKYRSTNPQFTPDRSLNDLRELPPFRMESFSQEFAFQFSLVQPPTVVNTSRGPRNLADIITDLLGGKEEVVVKSGPVASTVTLAPKIQLSLRTAVGRINNKYAELIRDAAAKTGVSPKLITAFMAVESRGYADARSNKHRPVKYQGMGLMQLITSAQKDTGVTDPYDPKQSIDGGALLIKRLLKVYNGDMTLMIWAYHSGPGNLKKHQDRLRAKGLPVNMPHATVNPWDVEYIELFNYAYTLAGGTPTVTQPEVASLTERNIPLDAEAALRALGPIGPAEDLDELRKTLNQKSPDSDEYKIGKALFALIEDGARIEINEITGKVAEVRDMVLRIPDGNGDIIPDSVSVGFGTNLVMVPLQGHRFPTVQYVGGQHTAATVSFRCESEVGRRFVSELKLLQNAHEQAAIGFREFVRSSGIQVESAMLNALGIQRVMIEDISVDTVPAHPESLAVTMRFIQAALPSQKQHVLIGKSEVSIEGIALQTLGTIFSKGWLRAYFVDEVQTVFGEQPPKGFEVIEEAKRPIGIQGGRRSFDDGFDRKEYKIKIKRVKIEVTRAGLSQIAGVGTGRLTKLAEELQERVNFAVPDDEKNGRLTSMLDHVGFAGTKFNLDGGLPDVQVPAIFIDKLLGTVNTPGAVHDPVMKIILSITAQKLIGILGVVGPSGKPIDKDFAVLVEQFGSMLTYTPGHEAYPDLMLPPNPITGLRHDTTPDFFLFNESDVKMSNSNLQKLLFNDISNSPKTKGLQQGLLALENTLGGIRQVYGVETVASSIGEIVQAAHLGRSGIYMDEGGVHKTTGESAKGKERILTRLPPEISNSLISDPAQSSVVLETNISIRQDNFGEQDGKNYDNKARLSYHFQNSPYKQLFETPPSNVNRISQIFEGDEYKKIFTEFQERYEGNHYAVRRSFPTFKVFFVEEEGEISANTDSPLEAKLFRQYALDDFYGVNSINEINIVNNKDMAASVCVLSIMDLDGILYNRKFLPPESTFGRRSSKTLEKKNPFLNTVIKEGMKVVVKLGYFNDPDALDLVFSGQIVQFEGNHMVEIVCQSYGTELICKRFGTDPSENAANYNSTTAELLHDLMDREELRHFGRWELKDIDLLGKLFGHEKLRPDGQIKKVWSWKPSVVDDNLFVPTLDTYLSTWQRICGDLEYVYFDTTIWDVFKEMELRHPGLIAYPIPYGKDTGARMTMFFGHPSMNYLSRPPGDSTELEGEFSGNNVNSLDMRKLIVQFGGGSLNQKNPAEIQAAYVRGLTVLSIVPDSNISNVRASLARSGKFGAIQAAVVTDSMIEGLLLMKPQAKKILEKINETAKEYQGDPTLVPANKFWQSTMIFQEGRMRPFRNYELVTSLHDIIDNSIRCDHRDTFNSVTLQYTDGGFFSGSDVDFDEASRGVDLGELTVNADDNIKDHHIRRTIETWPNCSTEDLARRYASQLMANSLKKTYRGELTILGKPHLKPYDILWIYDNYSDMAGPIEIEEVVHSFSSSTGFTTEIVPNMIVVVKEEVTTLMVDAAGAFFTEHLKDFTNGFWLGSSVIVGGGLGGTLIAGRGAIAAGSQVGQVLGAKAALGNVGLGVAGAGLIAEQDDPEGGGSDAAGFATGLATGVAFVINPIIPAVAGIVAGALLYKLLKYNATREPILITPLIKQGKPFVTGLEGMESDGLLITDFFDPKKRDAATEVFIKKKWRYFADGIKDANEILELGWTTWSNR